MDFDELYIEYEELVDAGEIDPKKVSVEDYVADRISDLFDQAELYLER